MKWLAWGVLVGFVAVQQASCWVLFHPVYGFLAYFPSCVVLGVLELLCRVMPSPVVSDEVVAMRRRVGWALGAYALAIPVLMWKLFGVAVVAAAGVRLVRGPRLRVVAPAALGLVLLALLAALEGFAEDPAWGLELRWGLAPAGVLLLAHAGWLAWRSRLPTTANPDAPARRPG